MEINEIYGIYQVIVRDKEKSRQKSCSYWKCRCLKCGAEQSVRSDNLKRCPKSCPECKDSLLNQRFDRLLVIQKGKLDSNGHRYWICQCDCGNQVEVNGDNLRRKLTRSCGCLHRELMSQCMSEDITGQRFGKLIALKRVSACGEPTQWLCQCDCGNITIVRTANLKNNHTSSCGCIVSKGEELIIKLLLEMNISFKSQYSFPALPKRYYDFYLPDQHICIEFDGIQHFKYVPSWHKSEEGFKIAQQRDKEKTEFCVNSNIKLIRIPYWDYSKLNQEYLKEKMSYE